MNYKRACQILELDLDLNNNFDFYTNQRLSVDKIKRQYRLHALKYHPDKNKSDDAQSKFQEIHDAYEYLLKHWDYRCSDGRSSDGIRSDCSYGDGDDYKHTLFSFLNNIWSGGLDDYGGLTPIINKLIYMIIMRITNSCENKALEILEKIDRNMLNKLYGVFCKYADVFHFSEDFLKNIQQVLSNKINKDECIVLNPFLDDLFENNLYRLSVSGKTYYIPLWHNELVYDNSGCDLYVKCSPLLPENMEIDERNNLHVFVKYPVQDLLGKERILLECSKQTFSFSPSQLKVMRTQTLVLPHSGISCINTENIYDVSKKADVIIHVELD